MGTPVKKIYVAFLLVAFLTLTFCALIPAPGDSGDKCESLIGEKELPEGWKILKHVVAEDSLAESLSRKTGAKTRGVINDVLLTPAGGVQVNYIFCDDKKSARRMAGYLVPLVSGQNLIVVSGAVAVEIVGEQYDARLLVLDLLQLGEIEKNKIMGEGIPSGLAISLEFYVDDADLQRIDKNLGGVVINVMNQHFAKRGNRVARVNYIECDSAQSAAALSLALSEGAAKQGTGNIYMSRGKVAIEIIADEDRVRSKLREAFFVSLKGYRTREAEYEVSFNVALIEAGPGNTELLALSNFLWARFPDASETVPDDVLKKLAELNPSHELKLLSGADDDSYSVEYEFDPEPEKIVEDGRFLIARFDGAPTYLEIPYVEVTAKFEINPRTPDEISRSVLTDRERKSLTASTDFFPSDHERVKEKLTAVVGDATEPLAKVKAIQSYVYKEIKYAGPSEGSRYGTVNAMRRKYGKCWDKADIFTTLCRAAGIPAREVVGWLYRTSGHVWCEVFIDGKGWLAVDPTKPGLGTDNFYIPFFGVDDGPLGLLYVSFPEVERVEIDLPANGAEKE